MDISATRQRRTAAGTSTRELGFAYDVARTIDRPAAEVAAYLFNPRTMPQYSALLYAVEDPDDRSPWQRHKLRANVRILGVAMTLEGRLVSLDLDRRRVAVRLEPEGCDGFIFHELIVDEDGDQSVVHLNNFMVPPRWLSDTVETSMLRTYVEKTAVFALDNIQAILEARQEGAMAEAVRRGVALVSPDPSIGTPPP